MKQLTHWPKVLRALDVSQWKRAMLPTVVCAIGLMVMVLFTACAGVTTTNGTTTVTGTIKSIDTNTGSVTLSVAGQTVTINGLTPAQASALQSQVGKMYTIQATQNSDGTYTITAGTNPASSAPGTPEGIETPNPNETPNATEPVGSNGNVSFIGKVQSVSNGSIVVSMPDSSTLSMSIVNGQTDLSDFNGGLPSAGQTIKVAADANPDGSFLATKLSATDQSDLSDQTKLNTVDFQGVTTSAVGSDRVIHFAVGKKSYSYTIGSTADLGDFNNNAQAISNNQAVKVEVLFNGSTGTVVKVGNANG
jgi:hypothetical protein